MTETTYKAYSSYDELSPQAKKLLSYCNSQEIGSPLSMCRTMQEDAKGMKLYYLNEVERYLINE